MEEPGEGTDVREDAEGSEADEAEGEPNGDTEEGEEDELGEGLGSLISFQNLENVMKHIIRKFKMAEEHRNMHDSQMTDLKTQLEARATINAMDEVASELKTKVDAFNKALTGSKEQISGLDSQIERNRVLCQTIDKKLEAAVKEKAVQDRLIRDTQDSLQDKVAVAELNMFEAKFAGYTTKLEHQEVINMLSHYTRIDVTERVAESVKVLGMQFDDYTRTAKIEEQLQELRDWVSTELTNYAKAQATMNKMEDLQNQIRDQVLAFERVHSLMDDKIRSLSDRMTSIYTELNDDIHMRALADNLLDVQKDLRKYALRAETDAFQQDCVPKLKFCVDSIRQFDERLTRQDNAINRVDEVLLDKAGKYDIVVANSRIEQCFQKDKAMAEFQRMFERLEWMNKRLEHYIETETERFQQFQPPDYEPVFNDINQRIQLKADKADMVEMYQLKANRIDADELAKLQDTIHRQLEYLSVTTFGLSKLVLTESKPGDNMRIRAQQKQQVLMQSEALWHWILHNDPPKNLDTLRPPGASSAQAAISQNQGHNRPGHDIKLSAAEMEAANRQKRALDEERGAKLEKKFGLAGLQ
mmetsp:Transcript_2479/g.4250  ORF Transcript_2479/g.4250 Transcript_2479/m.4250 type:complete len:585 (-) Transcript_2479:28-1782(-)